MFSNFWSDRSSTLVWEDDIKQNKILLLSNSSIDSERYRNWKRNRPPDLVRVDAIATHFSLNDIRMVPGVVYVWQSADDSCAFVYDGIHRLLAAIRADHPMHLLMHVKTTTKEQEIIDDFVALNQSISVPSVFMEESANEVKQRVCVAVAETMCARFPAFVSASRKPALHNFSRDLLIEFIASLPIDFAQPDLENRIVSAILELNEEAREFVRNRGIRTPQKCIAHDFFVFFLGRSVIQDRLVVALS